MAKPTRIVIDDSETLPPPYGGHQPEKSLPKKPVRERRVGDGGYPPRPPYGPPVRWRPGVSRGA